MRAVIQRVVRASVEVDGATVGSIGGGLLILFAVEQGEDASDIDYLVSKIANLRIFNDEAGVMNRSLLDVGADALVVSQFTLFAQTRKGNRPSYIRSARGVHLYISLGIGLDCFAKIVLTQLFVA